MRATRGRQAAAAVRAAFVLAATLACLSILVPSAATAAVTAKELETSASSTGANQFTTGSITPTAYNLVLVWVTSTRANTPPIPTLSGIFPTWDQVTTVTWNSISKPKTRTTLFRAMGASPTAGSITITFGNNQQGCRWSVIQFGQVDTSGANGSGAVVQSASNATDGNTTLAVILGAMRNATDATAGSFVNLIPNDTTSITPGSGYDAFTAYSNDVGTIRSEWKATGSTTVNATSTSSAMAGIAVEIADGAYNYRRSITIKAQMTASVGACSAGTTPSNFPLLVSRTDTSFKTVVNGGTIYSLSGYDIIFRAADGVTQLDHEIESYDGVNGTIVAWVRVPTMTYNADTTIYMYYSNPAVTSATANPTGVWDANYRAVWHLKDATAATVTDSTTTPNNGTPQLSPPQTAGAIDGSLSFNGSTQYVLVNNSTDLQLAPPFTVSSWVKTTSTDSQSRLIVAKWLTGQTPPAKNYWFGKYWTGSANVLRFYGNATQYVDFAFGGTPNLADGNWHYVVGVAGASTLTLYIDGVAQTPVGFSGTSESTGTSALHIASSPDAAGQIWSGGLDEVRLSSTGRDGCWIGVESTSVTQNANPVYLEMGAQSLAGPTAIKLTSLGATSYPGQGVLVSWRTGFEVDNLGFHVYREVGTERVRLTPSLVAGSALFAGAGTALTAGRAYAWWDRQPVTGGVYWLEEWDLSGEKRWHGPVSVQPGPVGAQAQAQRLAPVASGAPVQTSSPVLAGLGQRSASPLGVARAQSAPSSPLRQGIRRKFQQGVGPGDDRLAVQWALASQPAVKLLVSEDGWYRVRQEELVAAGLDPNVDPRALQLFADGEQVPILVDTKQPGRFTSGDGIGFYGQGLDTPSTAMRVYWLVAGSGAGARIQKESRGGQWAEGPSSFLSEVERADRTLYLPALLNGDEENFFGAVVTATPVVQSVRVPHVDRASPGDLVVRLVGGTQKPHQVGVELNAVRVGTLAWEGMTEGELVVPLGPGMIAEGSNQVTLAAEGGDGDVSVVESVGLRYAHTWQADSDGLEFGLGGYQQVTIGGFANSQIKVLDITDPSAVEMLSDEVDQDGTTYRVTVGVPESGERTLLAVGTGAVRHPVGVMPNRPTAWHAVSPGADLVIIGHRSLLPAVEPLRALREKQGLKVAVVDVENVYDEFSYGAKDPQAIRDFMAYAKAAWSRPPRYLLLVGDASFDPRNYLGNGWADLVPTKLVDTTYMETASDDWMTDFDGDGIADIPVGRIPVQGLADAIVVINKIVSYDGSARFNRVLLVADANDDDNDFEGLTRKAEAAVPSTVWPEEVFRGQLGDSAAKDKLASQLNLGQTVINYVGHGSVGEWHGGLLTSDEARALRNYWYPFVVTMTCLNGYFQDPQEESLAEALLAGPGGAVAVWASSGLTEAKSQALMDEALVQLLFSGSGTLGDATKAAKAATTDMDVRRSWILFGDPSTALMRR
jgi:hypothetical protein